MKDINTRQLRILELLSKNLPKSATKIEDYLVGVSRATINRDLDFLIQEDKIYKEGKGKNTLYFISKGYTYTKPFSIEYFYKNPNQRNTKHQYNLQVTNELKTVNIFTENELKKLEKLTKKFRNNVSSLDKTIINREFERIIVELSWMSSKIEGNTYSLIETELLLEKNKTASNHTKAETQMILNHKKAINYIRLNSNLFKKLSIETVLTVHSILIKELELDGIRNKPVGITGTIYRPMFNKKEIQEELKNIINLVNNTEIIFEKVVFSNILIAYLQPFIDGNKRTSRIIGNAVLMANKCAPLSLLTLDEKEYRRSLLLFYEQNNVSLFKKIFMEQYEFSIENYFLT